AVAAETERAPQDVARRGGDGLDVLAGVEAAAVQALELGLVVEGVHLADAAVHEELDDAPGAGAVVQAAALVGARGVGGEEPLAGEQVGEGDAAQAAAEMPQQLSPRDHCQSSVASSLQTPFQVCE